MSARATNLAILVLLVAELASGVGSYLAGSPGGRWVLWVHSLGGLSLVVLIGWKWRIVWRSFARRGAGFWALPSLLLGVLFLGTLASGLLWTVVALPELRLPGYGPIRPLVLHALLGAALAPPFLFHAIAHRPRARPVPRASRRAALRLLGVAGGGLVLWQRLEAVSALAGTERRFTGSREEGSFAGNAYPVTNWLGDTRQRVDRDAWRLTVGGAVRAPLRLGVEELLALLEPLAGSAAAERATLDCTAGWYTTQDWSGVAVGALLARAGVEPDARSVVVRSVTGYSRRFTLDEARSLLLATHVGSERLSAGHGFPARIVAPGRRGYWWVKWVDAIEVSARPAWWQPPLPLQ